MAAISDRDLVKEVIFFSLQSYITKMCNEYMSGEFV